MDKRAFVSAEFGVTSITEDRVRPFTIAADYNSALDGLELGPNASGGVELASNADARRTSPIDSYAAQASSFT